MAASLLARWAGTRVEELAALRRRLGGGSPAEGPTELTPREREVAAYAVRSGLADQLPARNDSSR